jgi:hypothetical protein
MKIETFKKGYEIREGSQRDGYFFEGEDFSDNPYILLKPEKVKVISEKQECIERDGGKLEHYDFTWRREKKLNAKQIRTLRKDVLRCDLSEDSLLRLVHTYGFAGASHHLFRDGSSSQLVFNLARKWDDSRIARRSESIEDIKSSLVRYKDARRLYKQACEDMESLRSLDAWEGLAWNLEFHLEKRVWTSISTMVNWGLGETVPAASLEWSESSAAVEVHSPIHGFMYVLWTDFVTDITGLRKTYCKLCTQPVWARRSTRQWCNRCRQKNYDRAKRKNVKAKGEAS